MIEAKPQIKKTELESYFKQFGKHVVGNETYFNTSYGKQRVLYTDWIASGRLYEPIEEIVCNSVGPMMANTHSFSSETGKASTYTYNHARKIIKEHVNASQDDVLVTTGTGMTGVLGHLQRIMNLQVPKGIKDKTFIQEQDRPVVFITHMEHHSNQVSWMETIADVVILEPDENNLVCPEILQKTLKNYADRKVKIGAFTACSNVTGIITPYYDLAKIMHRNGGIIIADFAASAPYVAIDMHPPEIDAQLDAVLFSPHKFLGGPGSCGVLVFNKKLYDIDTPDMPGGGNVKWTDPYGNFGYHDDIETLEDSGTPGILQVIRAALAIKLKEKMDVKKIAEREGELLKIAKSHLRDIPGVHILGDNEYKKIGCISFELKDMHYNLVVRLLNDRFGIQVRGGWSCASTYSHYLFKISKKESEAIVTDINNKNLTHKPGWVRLSLHPVMTNIELEFVCKAIKQVSENGATWAKDYSYNKRTNEFDHHTVDDSDIKTKSELIFEI